MKLVLSGNPYSTNNIYYHHGSRAFIKQLPKQRKEDYQKEARKQWRKKPLTGPVSVWIKIYFGDKRKRDWDNYHKLSMDALTKIVWEDDSQIRKATIELFYDKENPRTEIDVL